MRINVGSREIGDGCPPFIVAEIGSNWSSLEDCLNSIAQAKACGADAVKFQLFDFHTLFGVDNTCLSPEMRARAYDMGQYVLEECWLPKLAEKAKACGIEFMCSAFSPEGIDAVDPFVNVHKVASAEMTHKRMLEKLRAIGKPVFLSTGAHGAKDIGAAKMCLGETPTVLMYCVAAYPAREIALEEISMMRAEYYTLVGYSDHSTDVLVVPKNAVFTGACVLEKHVNFVGAQGPDSTHSLSGDEFRRMARSVRGEVQGFWGSNEQNPMVLRHNRRLIATRDIGPGDKFVEGENFGIYRSLKDDTHAFSAFAVDQVNGKHAAKAVKAGDGIGPGDI